MRHNLGTQHLQKLLYHTNELLHWVDKRRGSAAETINTLVFVRVIMKHLTESLTGQQLAEFVNAPLSLAAEPASKAAKGASHAQVLQITCVTYPPPRSITLLGHRLS